MSVALNRQAHSPRPAHFLPIPKTLTNYGLPASALVVYAALRYHARRRNVARVRIDTLVATSGVSRATVKRALTLLRHHHLLASVRTGRSSYYVLYPPSEPDNALMPAPNATPIPTEATLMSSRDDGTSAADPIASVATPPDAAPSVGRDLTQGDAQSELTVDKFAMAQSAPILKRDSVRTVCTCTSEQTPTFSKKGKPSFVKGHIDAKVLSNKSTKRSINPAILAPLISFVTASVRSGGLGWRLHRGNRERVEGLVQKIGIDMTWAIAIKAFDMGRGGGAAYWDWSLSQAGWPRSIDGIVPDVCENSSQRKWACRQPTNEP